MQGLTLQRKIKDLQNTNIIIGGDWNRVLNPAVDYHNYTHINNLKAHEKVFEMIEELKFIDVWREINPCNIIWLGNKRNCATIFLTHLTHMAWNPKQFKIAGIWFTNDLTRMAELNMADKFNKAKTNI